jgi:carbon monoxide dehydrogenase subunit G
MPRSEASIHIERTQDDIWAFVGDPDNLPVWNSAVVTAEADGPFAKGTRINGQVKFLGKRMDYVNEVTEFDAPNRSEYRSLESPFPFHGGTILEPDGNGTKLTTFLESDNIGGFFGKLGDPIVAKMYGRQMRSDLENLKEILESS